MAITKSKSDVVIFKVLDSLWHKVILVEDLLVFLYDVFENLVVVDMFVVDDVFIVVDFIVVVDVIVVFDVIVVGDVFVVSDDEGETFC